MELIIKGNTTLHNIVHWVRVKDNKFKLDVVVNEVVKVSRQSSCHFL